MNIEDIKIDVPKAPTPKRIQTEAQLAALRRHEFKKGQCGNPKGRPKNRINSLLKEILPKSKMKQLKQELTKDEVNTIEKQVLQLELSDLQLVAKADSTPAYLKALAMAIIIEMKNGKTSTVDKLRDRQYGAINQKMDVTGDLSFANLLIHSGQEEPNPLQELEEQDFIDKDEI